MKLQIFSDLHADVYAPKVIQLLPGIDAVIVAGDTCEGADKAFVTLRQIVPTEIPIIMVLGNHEFYRRCLPEEVALAKRLAPEFNIHLLENETVVLNGIRFIGASLWTDYRLYGEHAAPLIMAHAQEVMNDHRLIAWSKQPFRRFHPTEAWRLHLESRQYLETVLRTPFDGPSIVVTHHAPHPGSLHPIYKDDLLSAAFVSDLSTLLEGPYGPDLWVHGHVHHSFDYVVHKTRIVCNPNGYGSENPGFDPSLLVEVGP